MKKKSTFIISALLLSVATAHASDYSNSKAKRQYSSVQQSEEQENTSTSQLSNQDANLSKTSINGFTVSIGGGIQNRMKLSNITMASNDPNVTFQDNSTSNSYSSNNVSTGVGYSYLPVESIGFTSLLSYARSKVDDSGVTTHFNDFKAELNLAITANQFLDLHAGPNISFLTIDTADLGSVDSRKYSPKIGFQAGLGIHFTNVIGLSLDYFQDNSRTKFNYSDLTNISYDTSISGLRSNLVINF